MDVLKVDMEELVGGREEHVENRVDGDRRR